MRGHLNSAGDTIVEVMIAIAVVGALLGASYYTVNRAMANNLQAQEHAQALGLAQGQIEQIASTPSTELYSSANPVHCFKPSGDSTLLPLSSVSSLTDSTPISRFPAACQNIDTYFRVAFQYVTPPTVTSCINNYFKVYVFWPSATGNGDDSVMLSYKDPNSTACYVAP